MVAAAPPWASIRRVIEGADQALGERQGLGAAARIWAARTRRHRIAERRFAIGCRADPPTNTSDHRHILVHSSATRHAKSCHFTDRLRNDAVLRIATLDGVQPAALRELNDVLTKLLSGNENIKKSTLGGVRAAAEILNFMSGEQESSVMDNIKNYDNDMAQKIMDEMFVFDNIIDIDDRGIQLLLREVQSEMLIIALKGASQDLREKIFKNMSQRAGEMMREDLDSKGPVRLSEVEAQQKQILQIVRRLSIGRSCWAAARLIRVKAVHSPCHHTREKQKPAAGNDRRDESRAWWPTATPNSAPIRRAARLDAEQRGTGNQAHQEMDDIGPPVPPRCLSHRREIEAIAGSAHLGPEEGHEAATPMAARKRWTRKIATNSAGNRARTGRTFHALARPTADANKCGWRATGQGM